MNKPLNGQELLGAQATKEYPFPCSCYSVSDDNGVLHPVFCTHHLGEKLKAYEHFRITPKYARYFTTEQDARDRWSIIHRNYPEEAYGTDITVYPVGRWWLVLGWWGSAD